MSYEQRVRQQIEETQQVWDRLSKRISALRERHVLETRVEEKLRLEPLIEQDEAERQQIAERLDSLEAQLTVAVGQDSDLVHANGLDEIGISSYTVGRDSNLVQTNGLDEIGISSYNGNPFGDSGRLEDPTRFFDREELLRQIFEELDNGSSLSLVGDAQVGKSSLLAMIRRFGPERMQRPADVFAYLSMEWVDDEADFYDTLCAEFQIEPCRGGKLARSLRLSGKRYVLCLDEFEKMTWDGFTVKLRSHLRGLADGHAAPLTLVIASRSTLAALFPDSPQMTSPLAGFCHQLDIKPFPPDVARAFLEHRLQGTGIAFSDAQIQNLLAKTGGHPARLQQEAAALYRAVQK